MQILVRGMHRDVVDHARPALLALLGAVGFVLLIACANVANLLLVRASERGREIAVRAALGSGRGRILRQMLTESVVLATGGAVLGAMLAWYGVRVITALSPGNLPRIESVSIDARVLAFTGGLTLLAAVAFGLAPALRALAGNLADSLKDRGADTGGVRGNKVRTGLAVIEVALSLVLLIGAGLMLRSFARIQEVEPGFDPENVVTFTVPLQFMKYVTSESRASFLNELGERVREVPGVESVGGVAPLPLAGGELYSVGSYGRAGDPDDVYRANKADYKAVLPGYFEAMRIELRLQRLPPPHVRGAHHGRPRQPGGADPGRVVAMDPDVPVSGVATLGSYVSNAMAPTRFMLPLIGVFAGLALVLASLGLYGVISYSARQRTREIGVRVAFGADQGDVVRLVLGQGMVLAVSGVALGLAAAFALARVIDTLLVGVSPTDPVTYVGVPALLLTIAAVATWIPARRASAVQPVEALRAE